MNRLTLLALLPLSLAACAHEPEMLPSPDWGDEILQPDPVKPKPASGLPDGPIGSWPPGRYSFKVLDENGEPVIGPGGPVIRDIIVEPRRP